MISKSFTEILNQFGQNLVSFTFWRISDKLASWLILIVKIDTVEVILINVLENAFDLVLSHSSSRELVGSTSNTEKHFHIWTFLSQSVEAKLKGFWITSRELSSQTISIFGVIIVDWTGERYENLFNIRADVGKVTIYIGPPNALSAPGLIIPTKGSLGCWTLTSDR